MEAEEIVLFENGFEMQSQNDFRSSMKFHTLINIFYMQKDTIVKILSKLPFRKILKEICKDSKTTFSPTGNNKRPFFKRRIFIFWKKSHDVEKPKWQPIKFSKGFLKGKNFLK